MRKKQLVYYRGSDFNLRVETRVHYIAALLQIHIFILYHSWVIPSMNTASNYLIGIHDFYLFTPREACMSECSIQGELGGFLCFLEDCALCFSSLDVCCIIQLSNHTMYLKVKHLTSVFWIQLQVQCGYQELQPFQTCKQLLNIPTMFYNDVWTGSLLYPENNTR